MLERTRTFRLTRKRSFPGGALGLKLVRWLNKKHETERVVTLLDIALKIQRIAPKKRTFTLATDRHATEFSQVLDELNARLRSFSLSPQLSARAGSRFRVGWEPNITSRKVGRLFADAEEMAEVENVMRILALMEQGLLDRLRRCTCSRWLIARIRRQVFCSTACRQAQFRSTESYRKKRREYMKKYYDDHFGKARLDRTRRNHGGKR
ncbi:MAG: hypothetical protein LAO03_21705 [Acidobacteriia bacterium]|nr:hypothetical protein [Terriglobia bacterium]